jgi:hypothetical protein
MTPRIALMVMVLLFPIRVAAQGEQELLEFTRGSFREILQSVKGQPAIIHFWGATCGPCLVELPQWGEFLAGRPGAHIFMIHAEALPRNPRLLPEIIRRSGLIRARNWAFGDESSERLRFEIDPAWQGELPATMFVAANGTRHLAIGPAGFEAIRRWLTNGNHPSNAGGDLNAPATKIQSLGVRSNAFQIFF